MIPTIVLDFDGTLVERKWPEIGDFLPGAVEALTRLYESGCHLRVHSCRLSPYTPHGSRREPAELASEVQRVRRHLDDVGLTFVDIWLLEGKPPGAVYVDDKGERYNGRPGSWVKLADKILMRVKKEDDIYPVFDMGLAAREEELDVARDVRQEPSEDR